MLLPSGPANTRCSVCRFDPGGLHVQLSPAPGTGLQSPETGSQNRRYRDLPRTQGSSSTCFARPAGNLARALARLEPRPAPVQRRNSTGHRSELARPTPALVRDQASLLAPKLVRGDCLAASASRVCAMLLPSGRANTRCSVCRCDPGRCSFITQAGARNGFAEPRDRGPKSGLSRPQPAAETAGLPFEPAKMPANCALLGRDQDQSVGIELRGGGRSLDRTSLHLKFPANREINREFCRFPPLARFSAPNRQANSVACS